LVERKGQHRNNTGFRRDDNITDGDKFTIKAIMSKELSAKRGETFKAVKSALGFALLDRASLTLRWVWATVFAISELTGSEKHEIARIKTGINFRIKRCILTPYIN
jgi:hypothetical protein